MQRLLGGDPHPVVVERAGAVPGSGGRRRGRGRRRWPRCGRRRGWRRPGPRRCRTRAAAAGGARPAPGRAGAAPLRRRQHRGVVVDAELAGAATPTASASTEGELIVDLARSPGPGRRAGGPTASATGCRDGARSTTRSGPRSTTTSQLRRRHRGRRGDVARPRPLLHRRRRLHRSGVGPGRGARPRSRSSSTSRCAASRTGASRSRPPPIDGDEVLVKWTQVLPERQAPDRRVDACATPAAAASTTRRTCSTWSTCSRTCRPTDGGRGPGSSPRRRDPNRDVSRRPPG